MGMTGRAWRAWDGGQPKHLDAHERASDVAGGLGGVVQGSPHGPAIGRARAWRLPRHSRRGECRRDHRRLDPLGSRARADRAGDRALEGLRRAPARAGRACASSSAAFPEPADPLPLREPPSTLSVEGVALVPPGRSAVRCQRRVVCAHRAAVRLASSARARRASPPWRAPWWACGGRCGAACAWMGRRSTSGRPRRWAGTSATCHKTSSCSTAPLRRTSRASSPIADPEAIIRGGRASRRARA